ncbi:hypothetical protein [Nocardia sp. NPDC050435]|uniref:hypothetical protein n=1 Tax=Nocardia sp. NPDC050435 TaxID=3155040 RepID=UPI0033ED6443
MSFVIAFTFTLGIGVLVERFVRIVRPRLANRSRQRFELLVAMITAGAATTVLYFAPAAPDCEHRSFEPVAAARR